MSAACAMADAYVESSRSKADRRTVIVCTLLVLLDSMHVPRHKPPLPSLLSRPKVKVAVTGFTCYWQVTWDSDPIQDLACRLDPAVLHEHMSLDLWEVSRAGSAGAHSGSACCVHGQRHCWGPSFRQLGCGSSHRDRLCCYLWPHRYVVRSFLFVLLRVCCLHTMQNIVCRHLWPHHKFSACCCAALYACVYLELHACRTLLYSEAVQWKQQPAAI